MEEASSNYSSKQLDHLGLVSGICQEIGIVDRINSALGSNERQKVSYGHMLLAMILNGLGFTGRTLHMYSQYFENKPLECLLGTNISPEMLNDDALGRGLDAFYEYGVSELYLEVADALVDYLGLECESNHLDSSSFHYDGEEKVAEHEDEFKQLVITKGYSRDHRPDLNQVILNLICENQAGIPLYMKTSSGNKNDTQSFKQIVKSHIGSMKGAQQSRYLVGDSALYTEETIKELHGLKQLFVTRVPHKLKEAKQIIGSVSALQFETLENGYAGAWHNSQYGDVPQQWLVVKSEQAFKRERINLDKRVQRSAETSRKSFKKLCQEIFACDQDAQKALKSWERQQAYIVVGQPDITACCAYPKAGRPQKSAQPEHIGFKINGQLATSIDKRQTALEQLGIFIIATNDLSSELSMEKVLSTYKSQQSVEKGFRFLKSPDFLTSAIYLKKPERIEALLMVMTVCLAIYAALEHQIRASLKKQDTHFPDMKNKPCQNPTARWVFQCFEGITVLYIDEQQRFVINLKERQKIILLCLGAAYQKFYS